MEKWQLAGIISNDSRSEFILPSVGPGRSSFRAGKGRGAGRLVRFIRTALRRMTEVVALF